MKGKNMQKRNATSNEEEVVIILKKWQIPYLLGALSLSKKVQDWSYRIWIACTDTYDSHAFRWIINIRGLIKQIEEQTNIVDQCIEYGDEPTLAIVDAGVEKECKHCHEKLEVERLKLREKETNELNN